MSKKSIIICDLSKQEISDEDAMVTITIKAVGKKVGRSYDLSAESAAKLEQQLVGTNKLSNNWGFTSRASGKNDSRGEAGSKVSAEEPEIIDIDNEIPQDEVFIAEKKSQREHNPPTVSPQPPSSDFSKTLGDGTDCLHMNKGRLKLTIRDKERYAYKICKDCKRQIPEKSLDEKSKFLNTKV